MEMSRHVPWHAERNSHSEGIAAHLASHNEERKLLGLLLRFGELAPKTPRRGATTLCDATLVHSLETKILSERD